MLSLDLVVNVSLLISIALSAGMIDRSKLERHRMAEVVNGLFFGIAAVLVMLHPIDVGGGFIYDSRSIAVSLSSLFYGPSATVITCVVAGIGRIWISGHGVWAGLMVIGLSGIVGLAGYYAVHAFKIPLTGWKLYGFGLIVQLALLVLVFVLPEGQRWPALKSAGFTGLLVFPPATVLVGKIISTQVLFGRTMAASQKTKHNLEAMLHSINDAVVMLSSDSLVESMNSMAERLTGWTQAEARGKPLAQVFETVDEERGELLNDPMTGGDWVGLPTQSLLVDRTGTHVPITCSLAPIRSDQGAVTGMLLVFRDRTEAYHAHRLQQIRTDLLGYAASHTLDEVLIKALDDVGDLLGSPVGFYHFVGEDQNTLMLQQWSTRTVKEFCHAKGEKWHYPLEEAGVWADSVRYKKVVVHNDYAALSHKKGLPEGHAPVVRELVVPIIRQGKVVAILGVGNKTTDYTAGDEETVSYLADVTWHIIEKKKAEKALAESEIRYKNLIEHAPIGIFTTSSEGHPLSVNKTMSRILGLGSAEEAMTRYSDIGGMLYVNREKRAEALSQLTEKGFVDNFEFEARTVDERIVWLSMNARISKKNEDGSFEIEGFATDITSQKKLEHQFRQAQKMEAVGRLAGGVAHDYNNMLSVILGYAEIIMDTTSPNDPMHDKVTEIYNAARRSADVTRQLLTFARKQAITPKAIDVNNGVEGVLKMIRRLIGEHIDLIWLPGHVNQPVKMDPSQLDQILANLCVNARDAIRGGGKITIETSVVDVDADFCANNPDCAPGEYVLLAVSDDGSGMDREALDNLFEPFYTTKGTGQGTGLGLASVYGIVCQNNGFINVYSEIGVGSVFRVYLPVDKVEAVEAPREPVPMPASGQGEVILLVEDEQAILTMGRMMLEREGYTVVTSQSASNAQRLATEFIEGIHLLITDVIMPEMDGRELAVRLKKVLPDLKVMFMSGYTSNVIAQHGVLDEGVHFVQKPFSRNDFLKAVKEALADDMTESK